MKLLDTTDKDMLNVRKLFREYEEWLGVDLCFQGFETKLANLPGCYAPPNGVILIAIEDREIIGCVGIRPRVENEAELKRIYVQPSHQGRSIRKQLFQSAMLKAKENGYASEVLDTLHDAYGFKKIPAYYANPEEGVEYCRYVFS